MHGSDLYRNELLFDRRTATGARVPAPRAFEDKLIVRIALVDANNPHRHPALRAKRAPIRHLKCRATVALQRHAPSPTGRSAPPLGLQRIERDSVRSTCDGYRDLIFALDGTGRRAMSASGPKQTGAVAAHMSAFESKDFRGVRFGGRRWGLSGHRLVHRKCSLMAQSGHR